MLKEQKNDREVSEYFFRLRDDICSLYEDVEKNNKSILEEPHKFQKNTWRHRDKGGGEHFVMYGNVFEKVGVNVSKIYSSFSEKFAKKIPYVGKNRNFFATGLSIVAHMMSPLVPAMHFNVRYIRTEKHWFGGGMDMTPTFENKTDTAFFHDALKDLCDRHDISYYRKFKDECDRYFYLKHRKESRGIGGIFFDYLSTNYEKDFQFIQDLTNNLNNIFLPIVLTNISKEWTHKEKDIQLFKRGKYVEFNLLYDRGTIFGLETGGNIDAILMSLPPQVKWR